MFTNKKMVRKEKGVKKFYSLLDKDNNEIGVFSGASPRAAAIKCARRGHKEIRLREHRKLKSHEWMVFVYSGSRKTVAAPPKDKRLPWMKDEITVGTAKRIRAEKISELEKKKTTSKKSKRGKK